MTIWQGKFDSGSADKFTAKIDELSDHIEVKFLDKNKSEIDPPDESDYTFSFSVADTNIVQVHQHEPGEYEFHLKGIAAGNTEIEFFVMHLGHVDVRTIKIPVNVVN